MTMVEGTSIDLGDAMPQDAVDSVAHIDAAVVETAEERWISYLL